ncbi:toxin PIN [Prevotella sp. oral taxon 376]|uniref:toxin PIN n=1 Tax=Prevotella sp. oral taxon 376 TaxID=712466 RepID=UPI000D1EF8C5|nr:toxin PIN [Prevotella sp. oral taxon 376]PTL33894.1 toxin PIN [Prevotella sp. oral taxon 376]
MKKYIKPTMKAKPLEMENCILAGSTSVGIGEGPATGPALSKGNNFFGDDDEEEVSESNRGYAPYSVWGE